jgi:3-hydroxyacyl-[acyl-carrier-protein] dehydratase
LRSIRKEIEEYMTKLVSEGQTLTSSFVFPEEFVGFQGHFPGKKILPGVCQIQCALTTLEKAHKKRVILKQIALAKYLAPVSPGDEVIFVCSILPEHDGQLTMKTVVSKNNTKISELKLQVRFAEEGTGC